MELNFISKQKKEILEADLKAKLEDLEILKKNLIRVVGTERNNCQREINDLLEVIEGLQKEIKKIDLSSLQKKSNNLEKTLNKYCKFIKKEINAAYNTSIYNNSFNKEIPETVKYLIFDLLHRNSQERNYNCLEKFVENLIIFLLDKELDQEIDNSVTLELDNWLQESLSQNNNITYSELIEQLRQENSLREEQCNPGLLVAVCEYLTDYFVEAWLIKDINQYIRDDAVNSNTCISLKFKVEQRSLEQDQVVIETDRIKTDEKLSNLSKLIRQLIDDLNKQEIDVEQIHIFLPYKLMNHQADCCQAYEDEQESIGEEYEVIIRCSERLRGKTRPTLQWKKKCLNLRSNLNQKITNGIVINGNETEAKLLENKLKKDKQAIAVKITKTFENEQPGELLWKSSMPIAVWIRKQLPEVDNETELNRLLRNESNSENIYLKDLPTKVTSSRIDASGHNPAESHFGRHICLLWDDPNLLPPEQLLTHARLS